MGIGNAHHFQHALHRAVLTEAAMQGVEDHVRIGLHKACGQVPVHVDPGHLESGCFERIRTGRTCGERNFTFHRPAAHQDCNMFHVPPP